MDKIFTKILNISLVVLIDADKFKKRNLPVVYFVLNMLYFNPFVILLFRIQLPRIEKL